MQQHREKPNYKKWTKLRKMKKKKTHENHPIWEEIMRIYRVCGIQKYSENKINRIGNTTSAMKWQRRSKLWTTNKTKKKNIQRIAQCENIFLYCVVYKIICIFSYKNQAKIKYKRNILWYILNLCMNVIYEGNCMIQINLCEEEKKSKKLDSLLFRANKAKRCFNRY